MAQDESGNFVLPTKEPVEAAAEGLGSRTPPDERLTIVLAPGADAYPLVNYEYAIVSTKQADAPRATAIRKFLPWCIVPRGDRRKPMLHWDKRAPASKYQKHQERQELDQSENDFDLIG